MNAQQEQGKLQSAAVTPASAGASSTSAEEEHRLQIERFEAFAMLLGNQEGVARKNSLAGHPSEKDTIHYSKFIHITDAEEEVMRLIPVEAAIREFQRGRDWLLSGTGSHMGEMTRAEQAAAVEARSADHTKTFDDALALLRAQFSKEDFAAFDSYLRQAFPHPTVSTPTKAADKVGRDTNPPAAGPK